MTEEEIKAAEAMVGYAFTDRALLKRGLTHASLVDSRLESNERLEFFGDAILGMVVCAYLFERYDDLLEGEMTKIKSMVVSRATCADVAEEMGLGDLLRLGKGMSNREALLSRSVVAAVFEAIIGSLYVDGGLEEARRFILDQLGDRIEKAYRSGHQSNFKSVLQQAAQQKYDQTPQYVILDEKGPDHAKCFEVCVELGASLRFELGPLKKQAEQMAALQALIDLELAEELDDGEIRLLSCDGQAIPQPED